MQFDQMRRRNFITLLGGAAAGWPLAARAQQPASKRPLIGFLGAASKEGGRYYSGFSLGMRDLGYMEPRDYVFEDRYADGDMGRLPLLAQELVTLKPDVIVASSTAGAVAVKHLTASIPIVCVGLSDPIGMGLVTSESRPGTNVTGTLLRLPGLTGKQLEIAVELMPKVSKIGVLFNVSNLSNAIQWREAESAGPTLGINVVPAEVRRADDVGPAFQAFLRDGVTIVIVLLDAMFLTARRQIAAFALVSRLPTIFGAREHVEDGGLVSYGVSQHANYRRAASYVDKILKGERAADLPIEFPTKVELVINLATAKALGTSIAPTLLARADEVIE
jgi:putative tryptophan/tyrosine transport system substrate-binding protein